MHKYCRSIVPFILGLFLFSCQNEKENPGVSDLSNLKVAVLDARPVFVDADAGKTWNIFGLQIVGKIMSEQTNGQYSVVISTTPPNGGPPFHVHEKEDELFYVLEGEYEFTCDDQKVVVTKGALVHLPRNHPHGFKNIGEQPGILMNTISPGGFEQFFEEIDQLPKDEPLDRQKVSAIASKYGLQFLPDKNSQQQ